MPPRDSVVKYVKLALASRPYILETMKLGIVNYSALARLIHREVERLAGRKITETGVKMAVLRAARELVDEGASARRLAVALVGSEIKLLDNLGVLSVDPGAVKKVLELLSAIRVDGYFQFVQGLSAVTLIGKEDILEKVYSSLERSEVKQFLRNQSAVVVVGPPEILVTPGVVSVVAMALSARGINLTEVVSSYRDVIFVLGSGEAARAYSLIRELLQSLKSLL